MNSKDKSPGANDEAFWKKWPDFVRYAVVGIFNTALGYGVILVAFHALGFPYLWANVAGYAFGLVNTFFWQKRWVFESRNQYRKEILPFLTVFAAGFLLNLLVVFLLGEKTSLHKNLCQLMGIAVYTATNFLGNKLWTFSRASR